METTGKTVKLNKFLSKRVANSNDDVSHTRIGNKTLHVYGGKWHIPEDDIDEFYQLYYDKVFENRNWEYITEKQLDKGGPILVDLDFCLGDNVDSFKASITNVVIPTLIKR